jgi:hypothetical protein
MTTKLYKPFSRETLIKERRTLRPFVITLEIGGAYLGIRLKGTRSSYRIPLERIWHLGAEIKATEIRLEKLRKRDERRRERACS